VQVSGTTNNSALQILQALINSAETSNNASVSSTEGAGQNVQGAQAGADNIAPPPPPPASFSDQFAPNSLAFLTSLQSSDSASTSTGLSGAVSLSGLSQGLNELTSALRDIQTALGASPSQTASSATASLASTSLTSTATAGATSLTSSTLATVLSELNTVLSSLEQADGAQHHHHHHHHGGGAQVDASSTDSTTVAATSTTSDSTTTTDTTATG